MHTLLHIIIILMTIAVLASLLDECRHAVSVSRWSKGVSIAAFFVFGLVLVPIVLLDPWHWPSIVVLSLILAFELWVSRSNARTYL